ncbi:MAG TPA: 3-hydroxyacyl-CoA dehydrogenase NAD-binding domain-containing protein [Gemmatimonadaceae bacterium]
MTNPAPRAVAILGCGTIGGGWAALFAAYGAHVRVVDPDPAAVQRASAALAIACDIGVGGGTRGPIEAVPTAADAADAADWIQESLPERLERKRAVFAELEGHVSPAAIVASSTSTFTGSALAEGRSFAGRVVVAHPLHPVYAVPVVELCPARGTSLEALDRAERLLRAVGREPIVVRAELAGLVGHRLTAALLREAIDLVARGAITARDLDRVVSHGIATGWAAAGPFATEAIGNAGAGRNSDAAAAHLESVLAPLWRSLASWPGLDAARAESLRAALDGMGAGGGGVSEREWAERIARGRR